jgi:predicted nucleotidyltransferase
MERTDEILDSLRQVKTELAAIFKVEEIGLFGSVIRGEQREDSDIDILVSPCLKKRNHFNLQYLPRLAGGGDDAIPLLCEYPNGSLCLPPDKLH